MPTTHPSESVSELERENCALRLKLERAENIIRTFQYDAAGLMERHQVEESLRQSEARLQMELADTKLLQSISAHLIHEEHVDKLYSEITDAALTIMQSDFSSMQMYYPERGTAGELRLLASTGLNQEGKDFWAWVGVEAGTTCAVAMRTGKRFMSSDMYTCEYVVSTPDHEMFARAGVLAAQSTPLFSRSGELLGMISTHWRRNHTPSDRDLNLLDILARQAADLIERKKGEEALRRSQIALTEADRRKDEFLATLAHELRNPLAPIRNALQIIQTDPTSNKVQELLPMMDRQVIHLVRLIDDLLDVSRIRQGKIELRKEKITLQSAVRDATELCLPFVKSNGHSLILNVPDEPLWINADSTRVAQIISNLLNNAVKYTPHGGKITVSAHSENGRAVLSVSDTGQGIPADMLPKVFDLFTQVDRTLERSLGGLGIGLALVKQFLDMHDGEIEAKSPGLNMGSTFTIRLPLVSAPEVGHDKEIVTDDLTSMAYAETLRVLVVDDNVASAQTMGWILELDGHEAKLAHDGNDALAVAIEFKPDAILLDIDLPGMNGHDLCRELRKKPQFKNTLLVAQTGFGQDRDRLLAKEAGFDHHLVKPVDLAQLSKLLADTSVSKTPRF